MKDLIITAVKAVGRDDKLTAMLYRVLAHSQVHTLVRDGNRACPIGAEIGGQVHTFLACFSSQVIAVRTFKYYAGLPENKAFTARIRPIAALKLFIAAAQIGLAIYINPKNRPEERLFLSPAEVKDFLAGPWALNIQSPDQASRHPFLNRSRHGRKIIDSRNTKLPISEIDFDRPFSQSQLAEIFGVSENLVVKEITELERNGTLDLAADSISLANSKKNGRATDEAARYYDPVVAFHLGYKIEGPRGHEFRRWHTRLLQDYLSAQRALEVERDDLRNRLENTGRTVESLESELNEKQQYISDLEALPEKATENLNRLNQELLLKDKQIADLKSELEAAGQWICPESVMEAFEAARSRYSSRLVFHERVAQSISEFSLNNDLKAAVEAVKMFKALAEVLHPMKFELDSFSEEQFRNETGLALSMTESKASKKEKAIEETRTCLYNGQKITFYPHLKKAIQKVSMRLHFQFLNDERKILICHLGEHLPNAMTKYLK